MMTGRYVALDFETSGYAAHSACAVGLCRIEGGVVTDRFYSLIRPPSSRVLFTHVHGLTWPLLKDAPTFTELWPQLAAFMEGCCMRPARLWGLYSRSCLFCARSKGHAAACRWRRGRWTASVTTSASRWTTITPAPMPGPARRSICAFAAWGSRTAR